MPYKRHEPIDEREMDRTRYDGHHSICQTLRDIYHLTEDEEIRLKARIAMSMAKSMQRKLKEYRDQQLENATPSVVVSPSEEIPPWESTMSVK